MTPLADYLTMRENEDVYVEFFEHFVRNVVGKIEYKHRLAHGCPESSQDMCTVADEAFALLLLDNNYERWVDIEENRDESDQMRQAFVREYGTKASVRHWMSSVKPKYTGSGLNLVKAPVVPLANRKGANQSSSNATTEKAWSEEGIQRFNELVEEVKTNRATFDQTWFPKYLATVRDTDADSDGDEDGGEGKKKKKKMTMPYVGLWD